MRGVFSCPSCEYREEPSLRISYCPRCGVPLRWVDEVPPLSPGELRGRGVWRYRAILPDAEPVSLGEGGTPLLESKLGKALGVRVFWKLEFLNPTGSFKDRGAAVMVSALSALGAKVLVDDSSGNAGAALAAYAAAAGLAARLFVPAQASGPKIRQIRAYGAEVVRVFGPRPAATAAVHRACAEDPDLVHASHNASPFFLAGLMTLACEIAEDLGWRAPDHLVVPVGGGGLLLGLFYGFSLLASLGLVEKIPHIHAAQAAACMPVVAALRMGSPEPAQVEMGKTAAEGARIPRPERGKEILAGIRATDGQGLALTEEEILRAQGDLAKQGLYVEPTAALAPAALPRLCALGIIRPGETVVVPFTGFGLKNRRVKEESCWWECCRTPTIIW